MSVEKFKISKSSQGFSTVPNTVIKSLKSDLELLGFYLYLLHLPEDWVFYKTELKKSIGVGINKLERMLGQLAQMNLVTTAQMRNESGHFAQIDICVHDGTSFKNIYLNDAQPCIKNGGTVIGGTDMGSYKRKIDKENINKQNKDQELYCAPDGARSRFDEFWSVYPRKKDKARAKQVWVRKGLNAIADKIIDKVSQQMRLDNQWQTAQFIPHPATYLRNERWEDEIELRKDPIEQKQRKMSPGRKEAARIFKAIREGVH